MVKFSFFTGVEQVLEFGGGNIEASFKGTSVALRIGKTDIDTNITNIKIEH